MFKGEETLRKATGVAGEEQAVVLAEGVTVLRNFGSSNALLIEGDGETVLVDALESSGYAEDALPYVQSPVGTLIYTHQHADHVGGAGVLASEAKVIIAHSSSGAKPLGRAELLADADKARMAKQLGMGLTPEEIISLGIGPLMPRKGGPQPLAPTVWNDEEQYVLKAGGRQLVLIAAPGETDDQQYVWLPEERLLCCGDNFYASFPNLYTIRGSQYRDVSQWVDSLEKLLALEAEILVPGHGEVIKGRDKIQALLGAYKEAIEFVLVQTLQRMNQGLSLQRIVDEVKLPSHLAEQDHLQELYGTVEWSVRAIYNGYYGWFDGNPLRLSSLPEQTQAEKYLALAGGREQVLSQAQSAHDNGEYQWSAELCDLIMRAGLADTDVRRLQAANFTILGRMQTSANGRHYYLMTAQELLSQA